MNIKDLYFSYGLQEIFKGVNLILNAQDHIGITGLNGAGKTTFFKLILKELEPDAGKIKLPENTRISLLPQVITENLTGNETVFEFLESARPIKQLEEQLNEIYQRMATSSIDEDFAIKKINSIQNKLEYWNYYEADAILLRLLNTLNIEDEILDKKVSEISGGQKSKVAFAKLLYENPEILLLDEPTNHLDKETRDSVISYLKNYKGMVLVISHDTDFLNQVTNKTLYLDKQTGSMELFSGNYDEFQKKKQMKEENLKRQASIQEKEIEKLTSLVNLYSNSSGKRKRMAESREKALNKLLANKIEIRKAPKNVNMGMKIEEESGMIPLSLKNVSFKYNKENEHFLLNNITFDIYKGEKFLIVGENGVGKSTLLKLIMTQLVPEEGTIKIGPKTKIGYYAQEHETIDLEKTILENFSDLNIERNRLRAHLGKFLFSEEEVNKKAKVLSPGERSRVALAKLALTGANLLLLDEPTNHLDPITQEIIAQVFKEYRGSILLVSHNPSFANNIGIERTLILPEGEVSYYNSKIVSYFENLNKK